MQDRTKQLSEREKEALRLLLAGHDAKSSARALGLSVHTINERLRDSRRKLGVSSSKEAARILAETEPSGPNPLGYKQFGVGEAGSVVTGEGHRDRRTWRSGTFWLIGGASIMLATIAAILLAQGSPAVTGSDPRPPVALAPTVASATEKSARAWLALVDAGKWDQSWDAASTMFKSQVTAAKWASMIEPVRKPLGTLATRSLKGAKQTNTLPGAPDGDYVMMQFTTAFSAQSSTTETIVLVREGSDWKVAGYFIRPA